MRYLLDLSNKKFTFKKCIAYWQTSSRIDRVRNKLDQTQILTYKIITRNAYISEKLPTHRRNYLKKKIYLQTSKKTNINYKYSVLHFNNILTFRDDRSKIIWTNRNHKNFLSMLQTIKSKLKLFKTRKVLAKTESFIYLSSIFTQSLLDEESS